MPWITNADGDREYVLSAYTKDDLPTWYEVYDEWYKKQQFFYDPEMDYPADPYWGIPHRKYLIATVCNQFNKMLFEDGVREPLLKFFNNYVKTGGTVSDIRFVIESDMSYLRMHVSELNESLDNYNNHIMDLYKKYNVGKDEAPPIYTLTIPGSQKNIFIVNNHPRINVDDINIPICVMPAVKVSMQPIDGKEAFLWSILDPAKIKMSEDFNNGHQLFAATMQYMLEPFRQYFENGVGWKDASGKLIDSTPVQKPSPDPAL